MRVSNLQELSRSQQEHFPCNFHPKQPMNYNNNPLKLFVEGGDKKEKEKEGGERPQKKLRGEQEKKGSEGSWAIERMIAFLKECL